MDYETLELTILSAEDLNQVNYFSKMDTYVVVSLSQSNSSKNITQEYKTLVDIENHKNPIWNFPIKFSLPTTTVNNYFFRFQIKCHRPFLCDKPVGEVIVPLSNLLSGVKSGGDHPTAFVSYQVKKPSGKPKGVLNFSFKFGSGKVKYPTVEMGHETGYPLGVSYADLPGSGQHPVAPSYGYPISGCGYPGLPSWSECPNQGGYGYSEMRQRNSNYSGFGDYCGAFAGFN